MERLHGLFKRKPKRTLNVYCTAGYPALDSTLEVVRSLQRSGADIVEIGMPYSDPLADGETIQASSAVALANGMTLTTLFDQLSGMRSGEDAVTVPIVLMGYMNPVLQYGFERFCRSAASVGVDALILPDLPPHEFEAAYSKILADHGLGFIFLVTPETSPERVRWLDKLSNGFLYAVSSSSTTGNDKGFGHLEAYIGSLKGLGLGNPVLVGFGIQDKAGFETVCRFADGAVIGSAYIKALGGEGNIEAKTMAFIGSIIGGSDMLDNDKK